MEQLGEEQWCGVAWGGEGARWKTGNWEPAHPHALSFRYVTWASLLFASRLSPLEKVFICASSYFQCGRGSKKRPHPVDWIPVGRLSTLGMIDPSVT